ncbi:MAG: AAA family ATPase [Candidatus Binatia bacterium]
MPQLDRVTVRGFKSIRALEDFELRGLNVLIGANGAGKSNFISLFRMLAELAERRLQLYVKEQDGPDALLFGTRKRTAQIEAEFYFARNGYRITLVPRGELLVFSREETWFSGDFAQSAHPLGSGHEEAKLSEVQDDIFAPYVRPAIARWRVYHFHDTSISAPVRQAQPLRDNLRLKPDAGNLAPFLRSLRERFPDNYKRIVETVRMVAPFFGDFVYRKEPAERIDLEWFEADDPDTARGPRQLSDGSLRFICLATLLLQPSHLQPDTILIDEPELGLHPYALTILAGLLRQARDVRQLIVSTQSVDLVNELTPEDVIVVDRKDGASVFKRLDAERLSDWLQEYALGELWKMNVLGGRPVP